MNRSIHPNTSIGAVHLTVRDLARSQAFYQERLGFAARAKEKATVRLGPAGASGRDLLVLHESPGARIVHGAPGLYHFAVLVPSRADLAAALWQLAVTRTPLQGASDHGVSEALYLADPEGNGIEIYRDRPRAEWPIKDGKLAMGTAALDLDHLLAEAPAGATEVPVPSGTVIGHMHLQVADIARAEEFYLGAVGFDLMARYGTAASFVSAGGYHHHVGFNTWHSLGAAPPPSDATGLKYFELQFPDDLARREVASRLKSAGVSVAEREEGPLVRDPSGNGMVLTTAVGR
ncbi:MAG TPA: VOC family protein [Gemmatimonadales bacterium]|jgi:catechol 2,3-dioxygenase